MMSMSLRVRVLIGVALVLAAVLGWRLLSGGEGLSDPDANVVRIERLKRKGDVAALAREASGSNVKVARLAVEALGHLGTKATPHIESAMQDSRPEIREKAALALGRAAGVEHSAPLAKAAGSDPSARVRASAVTALGRMHAYTEMQTLLAALEDEDVDVRRRANAAIRRVLGVSFGFRANDPPEKRRRAIATIRRQWPQLKRYADSYYKSRRFKEKQPRR